MLSHKQSKFCIAVFESSFLTIYCGIVFTDFFVNSLNPETKIDCSIIKRQKQCTLFHSLLNSQKRCTSIDYLINSKNGRLYLNRLFSKLSKITLLNAEKHTAKNWCTFGHPWD